jgi:hypothetical protein
LCEQDLHLLKIINKFPGFSPFPMLSAYRKVTIQTVFSSWRTRLAVWLVADFEALSYQVTTTFDTSCAARIRTAPAINYTACWQLVLIHICLFVIYLAIIYCHFQSAQSYPRSTNLFFFERGQS